MLKMPCVDSISCRDQWILPNLHSYNIGRCKRTDYILGDLGSIFKVTGGQ